MTYTDRYEIMNSDEFIAQCAIALSDWVRYWAVNGTAEIEDETLREQTDTFISVYLENPKAYVNKIAVLAIAEPSVKDAVEVLDVNVKTAVDSILAHAISYLI